MSFVMDDVRALQRNATQRRIQDSEIEGLTPNSKSLEFPVSHILPVQYPRKRKVNLSGLYRDYSDIVPPPKRVKGYLLDFQSIFLSPKTPGGVKLKVSQIAKVFLVF